VHVFSDEEIIDITYATDSDDDAVLGVSQFEKKVAEAAAHFLDRPKFRPKTPLKSGCRGGGSKSPDRDTLRIYVLQDGVEDLHGGWCGTAFSRRDRQTVWGIDASQIEGSCTTTLRAPANITMSLFIMMVASTRGNQILHASSSQSLFFQACVSNNTQTGLLSSLTNV
jgi:hypothetical protein